MMYIPIVKTTAAEIRGFKELSKDVKCSIFPLFELTKGRTHKVNHPEGCLEKALEKALEAQPDGKFLLDLTSHEDLINSEIEELFNGDNGYNNWCNFIENTGQASRIIPVIQIDGDKFEESPELAKIDIIAQVNKLEQMCASGVAFRANFYIEIAELIGLLKTVCDGLETKEKLIVILDAEYIKPDTAESYANEIKDVISSIKLMLGLNKFAVSASSFPKSVTSSNYGGDSFGCFAIEEVQLNSLIRSLLPDIELIYSDYAMIHPVRYDVRGGTWIPRVDLPLQTEVYYCRYRREDGGYITAAREVVKNSKYTNVGSWGNMQIEAASKNNPNGLSPAFWISVRSNIHMTTQAIRTGSIQK